MLHLLPELSPKQRSAVLASYLGWTLDAFDFFILIFVMDDIAKEFGTDVKEVTFAIFLTLAARPLGALVFGLAADRFGRRPVLMIDILCFPCSNSLPALPRTLVFSLSFARSLVWPWGANGVSALHSRWKQFPLKRGAWCRDSSTGYPSGYLLASITYFALYGTIGWRGMFMVGALPALLVLFIRAKVEESPAFLARTTARQDSGLVRMLRDNAGRSSMSFCS